MTLALALLLLAAPAKAQDEAPAEDAGAAAIAATLVASTGTVYVHLHDDAEGDFHPAEDGTPLDEGDLVRTGTDGSAEVALDTSSLVQLSADTDFVVSSLDPSDAELHLGIGSLVAKLKHLGDGEQLRVTTPNAVAAVRGTELAVSQDEDDRPTTVGVFDEGLVSVTSAGSGQEVLLEPRQETSVRTGQAPVAARPLRDLVRLRVRVENARRRVQALAAMRRLSQSRRQALRRILRRKAALKAQELRRVREDRRRRDYASLRQRIQQRRQERRKARRQERRERRQEQLKKGAGGNRVQELRGRQQAELRSIDERQRAEVKALEERRKKEVSALRGRNRREANQRYNKELKDLKARFESERRAVRQRYAEELRKAQ